METNELYAVDKEQPLSGGLFGRSTQIEEATHPLNVGIHALVHAQLAKSCIGKPQLAGDDRIRIVYRHIEHAVFRAVLIHIVSHKLQKERIAALQSQLDKMQ